MRKNVDCWRVWLSEYDFVDFPTYKRAHRFAEKHNFVKIEKVIFGRTGIAAL